MVSDTQEWWSSRRKPADDSAMEDWNFLWDNVPESAKEEARKTVEDEQLRRRAQYLVPLAYLWYVAPEEVKVQLRHRWKEAKIPPRVSG
jgi:hypothetical protein